MRRLAPQGLLALAALSGCAPVVRADGECLNPLRAGVPDLDPVVTRPRMKEQKGVYDRIDVPSSKFESFVAVGQVRAPNDVMIQVQIWHTWPELADLRSYKITLRADDAAPVPVESVNAEVVSRRDRLETTTERTVRTPWGGTMTSLGIGEVESDLYRGRGVLYFRGQPLLSAKTRQLTLELRNPKQAYLFTWRFRG